MYDIDILVKKFHIRLTDDEQHIMVRAYNGIVDDEVKSRRDEILMYLQSKKHIEERRREAVASIEGLTEIYDCARQWDKYADDLNKAYESEDGLSICPPKPDTTSSNFSPSIRKPPPTIMRMNFISRTMMLNPSTGKSQWTGSPTAKITKEQYLT